MVIALLQGLPLDAWAARIKERVEAQEGYQTPEELPSFFEPEAQREAKIHWENVRAQEREEGGLGGGGGARRLGPAAQMRLANALGQQGMFT